MEGIKMMLGNLFLVDEDGGLWEVTVTANGMLVVERAEDEDTDFEPAMEPKQDEFDFTHEDEADDEIEVPLLDEDGDMVLIFDLV
jgi:hypothetical protein